MSADSLVRTKDWAFAGDCRRCYPSRVTPDREFIHDFLDGRLLSRVLGVERCARCLQRPSCVLSRASASPHAARFLSYNDGVFLFDLLSAIVDALVDASVPVFNVGSFYSLFLSLITLGMPRLLILGISNHSVTCLELDVPTIKLWYKIQCTIVC